MWGVGCARLRRAGEGAGARERAERAEAGDSGAERGEGTGQRERQGQRDSIADGTALRNIVGEEVAATLRASEIRLRGSFLCPMGTIISCVVSLTLQVAKKTPRRMPFAISQ